jgi:hydrogenase expression/formation protein HypD
VKYVDEFRDRDLAAQLATAIAAEARPDRHYRLMEFCGGHTHAVFRYGIRDLLSDNVELVHGPGCPVCVLPVPRIDAAIYLALQSGMILCSYGDMLRVPASRQNSLLKAKAAGADIRVVPSSSAALQIARDNPGRQVVFFAIGFETTTPPTAVAILEAKRLGLNNFSVFCNHVLTPAAILGLLESPEAQQAGGLKLDGIIGPSHVSTVIGSQAYAFLAEHYQLPVVIAGFEPLDVLQSILMLLRQLNEGRHVIENEYLRAVTPEGNRKAQQLVGKVFELRPSFAWRGLGELASSGLAIRPDYRQFDAEARFDIPTTDADDIKGCDCPAVLSGLKKPTDCKLFGSVCRPDSPKGACMVSSEGACAAYWHYGRSRGGMSATQRHSSP